MKMKNVTRLIIMVIALSAVSLGAYIYTNHQNVEPIHPLFIKPEYTEVDMDKPLKEQTRLIQIGKRTFDLPLMYVQSSLDKGKLQKDGILLDVILPDFKSKLELGSLEEYDELRKAGHISGILIEDAATRPPIETMIANRRMGIAKEESDSTFSGLNAYHWYHRRKDKLVFYYEIYLEKDEQGKIVSFVECSTKDSGATYPGCNHKFTDKGLLYDIHYNKSNYLTDWQECRNQAIKFFDKFEVKK